MKIISLLIVIALFFSLSVSAEGSFLDTKTAGKLTMIAILSAAAFVVKMLINRDRGEVAKLREQLGAPDRIMEYQEGFDHWRVEWYGNRSYIFRNGLLYRQQSNI